MMPTAGSLKLIEDGRGGLFVVAGRPNVGYTLYQVDLTEVATFARSWQAVSCAHDGVDTLADHPEWCPVRKVGV